MLVPAHIAPLCVHSTCSIRTVLQESRLSSTCSINVFRHDGTGFAKPEHKPGFVLVVVLSLMILLTIIAVGLLGLSAIELRSSTVGQNQASARANARMAMMLALGELLKSSVRTAA